MLIKLSACFSKRGGTSAGELCTSAENGCKTIFPRRTSQYRQYPADNTLQTKPKRQLCGLRTKPWGTPVSMVFSHCYVALPLADQFENGKRKTKFHRFTNVVPPYNCDVLPRDNRSSSPFGVTLTLTLNLNLTLTLILTPTLTLTLALTITFPNP